jgi:hypothetical protein
MRDDLDDRIDDRVDDRIDDRVDDRVDDRIDDHLPDLPALTATIEPLPGGLGALRRRLREPGRAGRPLGAMLAAACCAALAVWILRPPPLPRAADRGALRRLVVDSTQLPNPLAVGLGLVDRTPPQAASDPRIAPSAAAVFFWAPPAPPAPPAAGSPASPALPANH